MSFSKYKPMDRGKRLDDSPDDFPLLRAPGPVLPLLVTHLVMASHIHNSQKVSIVFGKNKTKSYNTAVIVKF